MRSSHVVLDAVDVRFDDDHAVAAAGLLLPATLAERLEIEQLTDELVDLGDRPGAARPGRKLLTLVHALVAGGDCIDDVEALRCGSTELGAWASGDGGLHGRDVAAVVHVRARPPARQGDRRTTGQGVAGGCRSR
jgi:hypothetical protein